jgi:uncharacterized protein (TIGR02996 family)
VPGTFAKKFARSLADKPEDYTLSPKQRGTLWQLFRKFHRQTKACRTGTEFLLFWEGLPPAQRQFENAISTTPDDAATRLVYADFLEENGQEALGAAQRWIVANELSPKLVAVGMSYGPSGDKPCNFEWSLGMTAWEQFGKADRGANRLAYHHRSREAAERQLAECLKGSA